MHQLLCGDIDPQFTQSHLIANVYLPRVCFFLNSSQLQVLAETINHGLVPQRKQVEQKGSSLFILQS